jgi:hypothetical protein
MLMVAALTLVIFSVLFTIGLFEHPFSGSVAILKLLGPDDIQAGARRG